jgi:hypothetical protein
LVSFISSHTHNFVALQKRNSGNKIGMKFNHGLTFYF